MGIARIIKLRSKAALKGRLTICTYDGPLMDRLVAQYGLEAAERMLRPRETIREDNLVVLAGRNLLRNFLAGDAPTGIERYAVGTDNTAAAAGNTTLGTEVFRGAITQTIKTNGLLTVKLYISSTEANGNTLVEGGPFCNGATDSADTGTLYARATHSALAKTAAKAAVYTHELVFTAG